MGLPTEKPRLRFFAPALWTCEGQCAFAVGRTTADAYDAWVQSRLLALRLANLDLRRGEVSVH